ncbi:hypothetical protein NDU88_007010 [Pleurodeles waltl]|uniref:Uncharacterized protein n=1 Tax=Pleurodeles waltl TaxID=8319 RepID=A0AAV7SRG7_PLEWA|nr:hypothetical protein NDU88_007010 [Pleurodeles waltl]
METPCKLRSSVLYSHARPISRARRGVAMVARAAPREQEELLKDALSRTVKTLRVRRETVERLALRGSGSPSRALYDQTISNRAEKQMPTRRRCVGSELVVTPHCQC